MTEHHAPRRARAPTDEMLALHARDIDDAPALWQDGLVAFRQALHLLDPADPGAPEHVAVQVTLLQAALDGLAAAHQRASGGEYGLALAEVRAPFERFIATAYLGLHPDEHTRLAETAGEPPTIAEMKDRLLASMLPKYGETIARGWRQKMDRWDERLSPAELLGATADYDICMEQACGVLSLLLTQAIRVRRTFGHADVAEVQVFAWRFARWRKHVRRSRARVAGTVQTDRDDDTKARVTCPGFGLGER